MFEIEVFQARSPRDLKYGFNFYIGKVFCSKCGEYGYLSLKISGSFQVVHYVYSHYDREKRHSVSIARFCTLSSLGKLVWHARRELKIAIPVWVR